MAHSLTVGAGVCSQNSLSNVSRRPRVDGTVSGHFHPYLPIFSDGTSACATIPLCSPPVHCRPDVCSPNWGSNHPVQGFYPEAPAVTAETSCFISRDCPSLNNHLEVSFAKANQCNSSKYSLQKFSSTCPESPSQFPKPIYSYSILIFLALKNSKTGSLPVSEIYSFMTEHFPYFKNMVYGQSALPTLMMHLQTAPDGWKNSVRHNLSLNKCFEKVENKNGNSSRKGCLWALNPAKVDKMQEELHKWRRKDPGTVRRSMAKPEDLDHLLGAKPNKFQSLATYNSMSMRSRMFSTALCYEQPRPPCSSSKHFPESVYISHSDPHPEPSYPLYPPYDQHVLAPQCMNSPGAVKMPPAYSVAPHEEHSRRRMHDLLMDGDAGCDIDTLNPSLMDLQLQGSLWEELKEDSARVVPSLSPSTLETVTEQSSYLQPTVSSTFDRVASPDKSICADRASESLWGQDQNYLNGVYSGMESFTGCLSSCTTSVSLM